MGGRERGTGALTPVAEHIANPLARYAGGPRDRRLRLARLSCLTDPFMQPLSRFRDRALARSEGFCGPPDKVEVVRHVPVVRVRYSGSPVSATALDRLGSTVGRCRQCFECAKPTSRRLPFRCALTGARPSGVVSRGDRSRRAAPSRERLRRQTGSWQLGGSGTLARDGTAIAIAPRSVRRSREEVKACPKSCKTTTT